LACASASEPGQAARKATKTAAMRPLRRVSDDAIITLSPSAGWDRQLVVNDDSIGCDVLEHILFILGHASSLSFSCQFFAFTPMFVYDAFLGKSIY
jgi:hypothetical protein